MKLRHKITITILAVTIILSITLITLFMFWSIYEVEDKVSKTFKHQNDQISFQINSMFNSRMNELNYVADQIENELSNNKNINNIEAILYNARNSFNMYQNLAFINAAGFKIFDTNRIGINEKINIDQLLLNLNEKNIYYLYQKDIDSNNEVITFNRKIFDHKGNAKGVLIANISVNSFNNIIKGISNDYDSTKKIEIIKDDGQVLFSNYREDKSDMAELNEINKYLKRYQTKSSFFQDSNYFYSIFKSANEFNQNNYWFLTIKESKLAAFKSFKYHTMLLILISLCFIFVASLIAYYLAQNITRPVEKASFALSDAGHGNFEAIQKIEISNDEFGELIYSLQNMTKKVDLLVKEQAMKYRVAAIGKMAGGIAHEINNPLHLINNHALILNKVLEKEDYYIKNDHDKQRIRRSLQSITQTVHRIADIISGLKSISKENGKDPIGLHTLTDILNNSLLLSRSTIETKEISLTIHNSIEDSAINCRFNQIQQVIFNLMTNAIDAVQNLPDNRWIEINIYSDRNENCVFEITNAGPKIDTEVIKNLFTPFYTTKSIGTSIGLGLTIAKGIIQNHKGEIYLDETKKNTCFVFKIPKMDINLNEEKDNRENAKQEIKKAA